MKIPTIETEFAELQVDIPEKEDFEGAFTVKSTNDVDLRGIVYSDCPYITVLNSQFEGKSIRIRFRFHAGHFCAGQTIEGRFTLACNFNEIAIPYHFHIVERSLLAAGGSVSSLEEFTELVRQHPLEAQKLFYSAEFSDFMEKQPMKIRLLYEGYRHGVPTARNLEEFLIATGQKERIRFSVDDRHREFYHVRENRKETMTITRNSWGHIEISVHSDADFITVEKERVSDAFFLGSVLTLNYYIHKDRLHAGKNYARITLDSCDLHDEIEIMATADEIATYQEELVSPEIVDDKKAGLDGASFVGSVFGLAVSGAARARQEFEKKQEEKSAHLRYRELVVSLLTEYENYRLSKASVGEWAEHSLGWLKELEGLTASEEEKQWYSLVKCQIYIANGQRQEALWIISDLKREIEDKKSVNWAYLLYLCTLIEREESYVNRLTAEIEGIFREQDENLALFWFLLFLREDYCKNSRSKLKAIGQWLCNGYDSPFLYIEAYYLLQQDPYLLTSFGPLEVKTLRWIKRHDAMTRDLSYQFFHLLSEEKEFRPELFALADAIYKRFPGDEYLKILTAYLLLGENYDADSLVYYGLAIEHDLQLPGLYETYMMCLPADFVEDLPRLLTKYFRFDTALSWDRLAIVYANIIANRIKEPQQYEQYLRRMELFAIDQMRQGHINGHLAVIYNDMIRLGMVNADIAAAMAPLLFVRQIGTSREIHRVLVYEEQLENPIIVSMTDGVAYAPIYSENYAVFLEEADGSLVAEDGTFLMDALFPVAELLPKLRNLAPQELPYILQYFETFNDRQQVAFLPAEEVASVEKFLDAREISAAYKRKLYPTLIRFLAGHSREEIMERHLLTAVDIASLQQETVTYVLTALITRGEYTRAYQLLLDYNGLDLPSDSLQRLCIHCCMEREEKDGFLLNLAARLLADDREVSFDILNYMNRFYVGPTETMLLLWKKAVGWGLETAELEERLLVQMLYTGNDAGGDSVFEDYLTHKANVMVAEAYATVMCRRFLLENIRCCDGVLAFVYRSILRDTHINESCRWGFLKAFAGRRLDEEEFKICDSLLRDAVTRNMYFGFFKEFDTRLIIKYHLYDKAFVEYHSDSHKGLYISCGQQEGEEMVEMYPGIYVKQYVLFFGDEIGYRIYTEEEELTTGTMDFGDLKEVGAGSRYDLLNHMQSDLLYQEEGQLLTRMKQYQGMNLVTETLFTIV